MTTTVTDLFRFRALLIPWGVRGITTWTTAGSSWYDGDTFNALVSQGMHNHWVGRVRCAGYDAPELTGDTKQAGEAATYFVRTLVDTGGIVYLNSIAFEPDQEDNFGRMLAEVTLADGSDLATLMRDSDHVVLKEGF